MCGEASPLIVRVDAMALTRLRMSARRGLLRRQQFPLGVLEAQGFAVRLDPFVYVQLPQRKCLCFLLP
jgi:hypothetical protein